MNVGESIGAFKPSFPFNLPIAVKILSVAETVPVVEVKPVIFLPVTVASAIDGKAAVPVKSPANWIFPLVLASASGAPDHTELSTYPLNALTLGYFISDVPSAVTLVLILAIVCFNASFPSNF